MDEAEKSRLAREARAIIEFEEDPHRAAIEDNPDKSHTSFATWASIFFMAYSFSAPIGLSFLAMAAVVQPVTRELGGERMLAWVVSSWSLAISCSFSLAGPLSDVFGRRYPILFGQVVVLIGCIVGGTAHSIGTLIAAETIIGLGCGFVFVSYAAVPEMVPNKWRSLGLGILEGGVAIPWGTIAVILGNALLQYASWRWIFYIAIINETIALAGTAFFFWPTPRPRGDFDKTRWQEIKEIDFVGLLLFAGGLAILLIGLTWGGEEEHPWNSAGTIAPIVIGLCVFVAAFVYDFTVPKNPCFPRSLFVLFRRYTLLIIVLFITGMNFHAMTPLLPQGARYMFTTDGIEIGVMSLPNTVMQGITGVLIPSLAHKIGYLKHQIVLACLLQAIFMAAPAGAVDPTINYWAYIFLPAVGVPMFIWITILSYAIASMHVPHSQLGLAMGLLGTSRSAGGAVGNAIFETIYHNQFDAHAPREVLAAAASHGLDVVRQGAAIVAAAIEYNRDVPGSLDGIKGITPAVKEALRAAVRHAYGKAFKIVFLVTLPFGIVALVCSLFVEDSTQYMTNHVAFAMDKGSFAHASGARAGAVDGAVVEAQDGSSSDKKQPDTPTEVEHQEVAVREVK